MSALSLTNESSVLRQAQDATPRNDRKVPVPRGVPMASRYPLERPELTAKIRHSWRVTHGFGRAKLEWSLEYQEKVRIRILTTTSKGRSGSEGGKSGNGPDRYTPAEIEKKWQVKWEADGIYEAADHVEGKENYFALTMFPYPSGDLHMGHWYAYAPADAFARFKRMQGYNVMHPQASAEPQPRVDARRQ